MITYSALILVVLIKVNDAKSLRKNSGDTAFREPTSAEDNVLYTGELAKLIHKVNEDTKNTGSQDENTGIQDENTGFQDENTGIQDENIGIQDENTGIQDDNTGFQDENTGIQYVNTGFQDENTNVRGRNTKGYRSLQGVDLDYYDLKNKRNDNGKTDLATIIKILGENYAVPSQAYDEAVREHLIKNPHILEEFKRNLWKKHQLPSSESGDNSNYNLILEKLLRRNAVFRAANENQDTPSRSRFDTKSNKHSAANDRVIHSGSNDDKNKKKNDVSFKSNKKNDYIEKKRFQEIGNSNIKKSYDTDKKKDSWDAITRNPKNWDDKTDKLIDKNNNKYKKNDKLNEDWHENSNNRNEKEPQKKFKKITNQDAWDKKMDWDKPKDTKSGKKDNSWDNWKSKSMEAADMLRKGRNDNWDKPQKKETIGFASYERQSKKDEWDRKDDFENEDRKPKKNDWDSKDDFRNDDRKPKKNDWDTRDDFRDDDRKPKKNDWDTKDDYRNDERKPKKNDWDTKDDFVNQKRDFKDDSFKITVRTTREWRDNRGGGGGGGGGGGVNKPFVPKISDYYNPRPRMRDNIERAVFKAFGRTSIPFVGKKGIYEEK